MYGAIYVDRRIRSRTCYARRRRVVVVGERSSPLQAGNSLVVEEDDVTKSLSESRLMLL
nr:hypothetical protein Iba_chr11aCG11590 [Ipomoea batatas]